MAWISVHKEVIGTKLRLLAKKIGGSQNEALGILVRLWLWAMTEADRDGSLPESGSKESRAEPLAAQWQAGNVDVLIADWNEPYFNQLESFPESKFKDMVDASSSAFIEIENGASYSAPGTDNLGKNSYWRK